MALRASWGPWLLLLACFLFCNTQTQKGLRGTQVHFPILGTVLWVAAGVSILVEDMGPRNPREGEREQSSHRSGPGSGLPLLTQSRDSTMDYR